jgi:hypothetical protein
LAIHKLQVCDIYAERSVPTKSTSCARSCNICGNKRLEEIKLIDIKRRGRLIFFAVSISLLSVIRHQPLPNILELQLKELDEESTSTAIV